MATVLKPSQPIDPTTTGTIRGIVRYDGVPPEPSKIPLASFAPCQNPKDHDDDVLIQDGKVQNAFVFIRSGIEEYIVPPPPSEAVTIDQKGCLYAPRVVGLRVGQSLAITNSDALLHNVHGLPKNSSSFNLAMDRGTPKILHTFDQPEVMVTIRCDVHPWMRAYVGVLDHPYFAVTGPDGSFELKNVPPGTYTLEVWHERLGRKTQQVIIGPGEEQAANWAFP